MEQYKVTNNNDGTVNINLNIGEDFANNLYQSELFNTSYLEKVKDEHVNNIIDYEKHIFYPAYLSANMEILAHNNFIDENGQITMVSPNSEEEASTNLDDYARDVNRISFNLYLRERKHDENNDYGSWQVEDEAFWNIWDGTMSAGTKVFNTSLSTGDVTNLNGYHGDLLGCLGFTDDDVFYQKNALKKSFLRISIYDTPYKQSQKLLYYSTLFFDTNVLYKKYTNMNIYNRTTEQRVYESGANIPDEYKLTATFTCTSKYDNSACSDGFYLYLFDGTVPMGVSRQLYMKIEFNNAKYGKTITLTSPMYTEGNYANENEIENNDPIEIGDDRFPLDYEIEYGDGHSYVDINKLYEDMYIPIFVRYNNTKNRYEWYIARNHGNIERTNDIFVTDNDKIVINLYEPRINGLKEVTKPEVRAIKFTALEDGSTVGLQSLRTNHVMESSLNGETWVSFNTGTTITLNKGESVYIRGIANTRSGSGTQFKLNNGSLKVSGNINTILDYTAEDIGSGFQLFEFCYAWLFGGQYTYALKNASDLKLPATTLANYCYQGMFVNCSSLTAAPALPATTLAEGCYNSMFQNCTSLTTAPELPATTLVDRCYYYMFVNCSSLTTAPELPATTLASGCYQSMFQNCSGLITAPELPATTLVDYCYSFMFEGCSSLTEAPELSATKLAQSCYGYMFRNCTSLTIAPELPATTLVSYCYYYIFYGCRSLNYIKCLAVNGINNQNNSTSYWVAGVASSGTFVKHPDATSWITGYNGIPNNWTVEDAVLE